LLRARFDCAKSAPKRFADAPGGIEASALLLLLGSHPWYAMVSDGVNPIIGAMLTARAPPAASRLLRAQPQ
jgi:hypothetical protein